LISFPRESNQEPPQRQLRAVQLFSRGHELLDVEQVRQIAANWARALGLLLAPSPGFSASFQISDELFQATKPKRSSPHTKIRRGKVTTSKPSPSCANVLAFVLYHVQQRNRIHNEKDATGRLVNVLSADNVIGKILRRNGKLRDKR
jgi:hypothetical protein